MLRPVTYVARPERPAVRRRSPVTRLREPLNEPNAACVVRACGASRESRFGLCRRGDPSAFKTDPTSSTSTVSWLEITSGSGPCSTSRQQSTTATFVVSTGGMHDPPRARGFQRGPGSGGPLWSRRRRSLRLDGLKSGRSRRQHDDVKPPTTTTNDDVEADDEKRQRSLSTRANSRAAYVKTMSAPARLIDNTASIMQRSPSSQPLAAAAFNIAYSPDTW